MIHFALWLHTGLQKKQNYSFPSDIADQSIYWAVSGWDLNLLLDAEAPIEEIEAFLAKYPAMPDIRIVKYALAVRLAVLLQIAERRRAAV